MNTELLKYHTHRNGLLMSDLAGLLGVHPSTLTRKMSGASDFNRNEIKMIKDNLGLSNTDLDAIFFVE